MRTNKQIPGAHKLTPQQQYLLRRVPATYQMNKDERPEPAEVKQARKVIERWDKEEGLRTCQAQKRNDALVEKAREAVYFATPEKALAIIQQCEKLLKGCRV